MRVLDLFCGAGGAAMGYHRAGFEVVGVDINPQPRYPFAFIQLGALDALDALFPDGSGGSWTLSDFDAIHASPPCQASTSLRSLHKDREYPELIPKTRDLLIATGLPYVIENVEGARRKLREPLMLCGSAFGLDLRRHRFFECVGFDVMSPGCAHGWQAARFISLDRRPRTQKTTVPVHGKGRMLASVVGVHGSLNYAGERSLRERAMGIDWMTVAELSQAIPPAYTEHIGCYLAAEVKRRSEVAA